MKYTIITHEIERRPTAQEHLTGEMPRILQTIEIEGLTYEQAIGCLEVLTDNYSRSAMRCFTRGKGKMKERGFVTFYWYRLH